MRSTKTGRAAYALRKQTVEPVFGIIKSVMGFRQLLLRGRVFQRRRLEHRQSGGFGKLLHRAGVQFPAPARRSIRLCVHADKLVFAVDEARQMNSRKLGRAGEQDAQRGICHGLQARSRWSFSSFLRMRCRFSTDR